MITLKGTTRKVEIYKDYVIKIPINELGIEANKQEYERYLSSPAYYAKCELLENNNLKMEFLKDYTNEIRDYIRGDIYRCNHKPVYYPEINTDCNNDCKNCKFSEVIYVPDYLEEFLKYKPKDSIQCGWSSDGILKYYDYADAR